ncbi:secologanin synthase-like [Coffea eugenioides]|uniref:7-deoxyloganic acid hydroxylase n=1 Tax=Coffea arabica TaxID=13443 RepID=A0A6P6TGB6_COFAR|nr:secologanin synthase-like [Coffea arabica]XP_027180824.1 secologanin synthase-like [Coffea eugenioides]
MEFMGFKLIAILGFIGYAVYWLYAMLDLYWFRPKKLEKCLRKQGFKGNPYRLFRGDLYESAKLLRDAHSKPIQLGDNIVKRMMPEVYNSVQTHGKNSFLWIGRFPKVTVTDPTLAKDALVRHATFHKSFHDLDPLIHILFGGMGAVEGEEWAKYRKITNPAFTLEKLKSMLPLFQSSCIDAVNKWASVIPEGGAGEVDVWPGAESISATAISTSLFGIGGEEGKKIVELLKELANHTWEKVKSVYFPGKRFLPTKSNLRMRALDRELRVKITDIINRKLQAMQAGESGGADFVGLLLESNLNEIKLQGNQKSAGLSIEDIYAVCKLFYWAGQDTSSTLVLWTLVLLSKHTEWQDRAREEVLQVFGDKMPDYDGINHLKIVSMILNEVLRLYPPLSELSKVASEDTQLGKYLIPAGVQVMMPQILLHYDPELWGDDVLEFKPERFSEGIMKATKIQGAYFPFSFGPRMCIGNNFALYSIKMAIAIILRTLSLELSPSYVHAPIRRVTLQPQYGAHLILRRL